MEYLIEHEDMDVDMAWLEVMKELDDAGVLKDFSAFFKDVGDISTIVETSTSGYIDMLKEWRRQQLAMNAWNNDVIETISYLMPDGTVWGWSSLDSLDVTVLETINDIIDLGGAVAEVNEILTTSAGPEEMARRLNEMKDALHDDGDKEKSVFEKAAEYLDGSKNSKLAESLKEDNFAGVPEYIKKRSFELERDGKTVAEAWETIMTELDDLGVLEGFVGALGYDVVNTGKNQTTFDEMRRNTGKYGRNLRRNSLIEAGAGYAQGIKRDDIIDTMYSLVGLGVSIDDINAAWAASNGNMVDFANRLRQIKQAAEQTTAALYGTTEIVDRVIANGSREEVGNYMQNVFGVGNVDLKNRPLVSSDAMQAAGYDVEDGSVSTIYSMAYTQTHNGKDYIIHVTPILPDGTVLSPENVESYVSGLAAQTGDMLEADTLGKGGNGIVLKIDEVTGSMEDAIEAGNEWDKNLHKLQERFLITGRIAQTKFFGKTIDAINELNDATPKSAKAIQLATDAYDEFYTEAGKATKAQEEYEAASKNMADGVEVTADDVANLAEYLGFVTPEALLENWDYAGAMLEEAIGQGTSALEALNAAAFINITGTSSADFSAIQGGLISVQNMAQDTVNALIALGMFTAETVTLPVDAWVQGADGTWTMQHLTGTQTILKPTGTNPLKGGGSKTSASSGSGGGGGGGGGSGKKGMTEVERMLDRQNQMQTIRDHRKDLYEATASYYENAGYLQGALKNMEKENEVLKENTKALEDDLAEVEKYMIQKQAELESMQESDKGYAEVASDLEKLQDKHQSLTLAIIKDREESDKLTESIKAMKNEIRDMQIDLLETVEEAVRDMHELERSMLDGRVEMEDAIIELIKERYERERDAIIENSEIQIDALQRESDLLSEQLELRKKMAEEEDKQAELMELEAKYARIIADPTRQKEALEIQNQINELRDEIAWDKAEDDVENQKKAIDDQIENIEDYVEYINNYYDDLFEHPKKLVEEMKEIIKGTDEEILEWLQANEDNWGDYSEAHKQQQIEDWQEMLMQMRGLEETYWEEAQAIIEQGDDAIIAFLKENSADYRQAGKLQAEAYVDEWLDKLDKLHKALQIINDEVTETKYDYIAPEGAEGGSGGSGGKGGDTPSNNPKPEDTKHGYSYTFDGVTWKSSG